MDAKEKAAELIRLARHNQKVFENATSYLKAYYDDMMAVADQVHNAEGLSGSIKNPVLIDKVYDSVQIIDTEYCERIAENVTKILAELKRYDSPTGM